MKKTLFAIITCFACLVMIGGCDMGNQCHDHDSHDHDGHEHSH